MTEIQEMARRLAECSLVIKGIELTDDQKEALRTLQENMEKIREIFQTIMNTLRDVVKKALDIIRIAWRHYTFQARYTHPDSQVYEWWLLMPACRQWVRLE